MLHNKTDTEGLNFNYSMTDISDLNKMAFSKSVDVVKVSFHTYIYKIKDYILLESGSALGNNVGPLIIAKNKFQTGDLKHLKIAIPGEFTTANLLLKVLFPEIKNKTSMIFSDIEDAVITGKADAGLIIHENRFTYQSRGLQKIADLGELWMKKTDAPVPLGGIIAKRELGPDTIIKLNSILKRSILFAIDNPESGMDFIKQHSNEMEEEVIKQHIGLYVNEFTVELGEKGHKAVDILKEMAEKTPSP
jgi:1,4-dihydroxy-6-naphthoate synthase